MRIRNYRVGDMPAFVHIQQLAAQVDETQPLSAQDFEAWFARPELEPEYNVFVITDDNDLLYWGQGESLEGVEGEIIGYTVVQFRRSAHAYHFLCQGAVYPEHRRRHAGRSLLISALNRVRMWGMDAAYEAEQQGLALYFEALLPLHDAASENLAAKCEMQPTDEATPEGMRLYRRALEL